MPLTKQAKTLNKNQVSSVLNYLASSRNTLRNEVIFLLSVKAGLRAKEIAGLKWEMVLESDATLAGFISLTNEASKGNSGRHIPLNKGLKARLAELLRLSDLLCMSDLSHASSFKEHDHDDDIERLIRPTSEWR